VLNKTSFTHTIMAVIFLTSMATSQTATGTPPFGSFGGGPFDTVNLANLNVHFAIPVLHKAGRGIPFNYDLTYDSSVWYPSSCSGGTPCWLPVPNWGWRGTTEVTTGYVSYQDTVTTVGSCEKDSYAYFYHDPLGVSHAFWPPIIQYIGPPRTCPSGSILPLTLLPVDGSGYSLTIASVTSAPTLTSRTGQVSTPPFNTGSGAACARNRCQRKPDHSEWQQSVL
jgi:hypothetical protein